MTSKNILFYYLWPLPALAVLYTPLAWTQTNADYISINRYSLVKTAPTEAQKDLMAVIIDVSFPESIETVGQAISQLLTVHGFRFSVISAGSFGQTVLYQLPLPKVHRQLGPMSLRTALNTLGGQSFVLRVNPVTREIAYSIREEHSSLISTHEIIRAKQGWDLSQQPDKAPPEGNPSSDHMITQYGPIASNDTLSRIALSLKPIDVSVEQAMISLFNANSHAFYLGNINYLRLDTFLNIPTREVMLSLSYEKAKALVWTHHREWLSTRSINTDFH